MQEGTVSLSHIIDQVSREKGIDSKILVETYGPKNDWAKEQGAAGLGYVIWYAALRGMSATQGALVQLSVAPLAALGAVLFLGERPGPRLLACGLPILGGIALALTSGLHSSRARG